MADMVIFCFQFGSSRSTKGRLNRYRSGARYDLSDFNEWISVWKQESFPDVHVKPVAQRRLPFSLFDLQEENWLRYQMCGSRRAGFIKKDRRGPKARGGLFLLSAEGLGTHFSHNGQASGGQSRGHSGQHSVREQVASVLTEGAAGSWDAPFPAKFEAASAPAAISGIPTTAHQSHFLLLMISPFRKWANWLTLFASRLFRHFVALGQKKRLTSFRL
jgi:hypothetical protein